MIVQMIILAPEETMEIEISEKYLPVYEALASKVRIKVIQLLAEKPMNIKELAQAVGVSSAIMTMHVRKLENAGIIDAKMIPSRGGVQKVCVLNNDDILIRFPRGENEERLYHQYTISVGHYTDFQVEPTCGLATPEKVIGEFDDPQYFLAPERVEAKILWFNKGYVEYKVANRLLASQIPEELEISLELSSEAPYANENWPSDISFFLNGVHIGTWTSPGDFADRKGRYSPDWWFPDINQYGLLKVIRINREGTFLDGNPLSDVTLDQVQIEQKQWTFRVAVLDDAKHIGGATLFGTGFGNYNQDIVMKLYYTEKKNKSEKAEKT
jgi:predicted transcriptional regulator